MSNPNMIRKAGQMTGRAAGIALKLFLALIFIFPFYWMISTSFKTYAESEQFPPLCIPIPGRWRGIRPCLRGWNWGCI